MKIINQSKRIAARRLKKSSPNGELVGLLNSMEFIPYTKVQIDNIWHRLFTKEESAYLDKTPEKTTKDWKKWILKMMFYRTCKAWHKMSAFLWTEGDKSYVFLNMSKHRTPDEFSDDICHEVGHLLWNKLDAKEKKRWKRQWRSLSAWLRGGRNEYNAEETFCEDFVYFTRGERRLMYNVGLFMKLFPAFICPI